VIPVKGKSYRNPLRLLEVFTNLPRDLPDNSTRDLIPWQRIEREFMPQIRAFTSP